ncbi:sulfurtransferase/chromate resistance protein [uncultured Shimia sp.]|uniref:sulfurtransferase/chromate resistance protein n=1 Tax=uncultured Shimia sp. TaxID=573152 RepID=UPI002603DF41|nr:sulfurtransferase/chromate resistance protein [uncultured Shimia sp.]
MPSLNEISPANLMRQLGGPDAPVILDVRIDGDLATHPFVVPTARRVAHTQVAALAPELVRQKAVVICHKGKKLSHGAAALLRTHGIAAEVLAGGILAWQAAELPCTPITALPPCSDAGSLWVTRHRPKVDRIACPWLIRRFIDPKARFLFVPPSEVLDVADRFQAIAFDTPDAPWGHVADQCSFDAMVKGFGLTHDPLERLAEVVRAADTNHLTKVPQAAGLLALSVGLSRLYKEDQAQLTAGLPLYDALYRWARDGANEVHEHV